MKQGYPNINKNKLPRVNSQLAVNNVSEFLHSDDKQRNSVNYNRENNIQEKFYFNTEMNMFDGKNKMEQKLIDKKSVDENKSFQKFRSISTGKSENHMVNRISRQKGLQKIIPLIPKIVDMQNNEIKQPDDNSIQSKYVQDNKLMMLDKDNNHWNQFQQEAEQLLQNNILKTQQKPLKHNSDHKNTNPLKKDPIKSDELEVQPEIQNIAKDLNIKYDQSVIIQKNDIQEEVKVQQQEYAKNNSNIIKDLEYYQNKTFFKNILSKKRPDQNVQLQPQKDEFEPYKKERVRFKSQEKKFAPVQQKQEEFNIVRQKLDIESFADNLRSMEICLGIDDYLQKSQKVVDQDYHDFRIVKQPPPNIPKPDQKQTIKCKQKLESSQEKIRLNSQEQKVYMQRPKSNIQTRSNNFKPPKPH